MPSPSILTGNSKDFLLSGANVSSACAHAKGAYSFISSYHVSLADIAAENIDSIDKKIAINIMTKITFSVSSLSKNDAFQTLISS